MRPEPPVPSYSATAILERMRDDRESDWPDRLLEAIAAHEGREGKGLSAREREMLSCLSHGMSVGESALLLGVAYGSARKYLLWARRKLRAKTTAHAVAIALRQGLIP